MKLRVEIKKIQCLLLAIGLNIAVTSAQETTVTEDQLLTIKLVSEDGTVLSGVKCFVAPQKPKPKEIVSYDRVSNKKGIIEIREQKGRFFNVCVDDDKSGYFGKMTVEIPLDDKNSLVTFVLRKYLELEGRIVTDKDEPISGILLQLMQPYGDSGGRKAVQTYTDENGRFVFANLKTGKRLEIRGANSDWQFDWQDVELGTPVIIRAKKTTPSLPTIHCQLVNSDGQRIVMNGGCYFEGPHPASPCSAFMEKGKFELINFPNGEYTLRVKGEDGQEIALRSSSFELPCTNNALEFVVEDQFKCVILVRDARNSKPITCAKVTISQMSNSKTFETDEHGVVAFDAWPEKMLIGVYSDGYLRMPRAMLMAKEDKIVIDLCPGEVLTGLVEDQSGSPIQRATISMYTSDELAEKTARTDVSGEFMLAGLPQGVAKMVVFAEGYAPIVETLNITTTNDIKVSVNKGIQVSFDIDPQIELFHDEQITEGQLWVLQTQVFGIAGAVACKPGESKGVQLLPDTYDLFWIGEKDVFKVGNVTVIKPGAVAVSVTEPPPDDVYPVGMFYKRVFGPGIIEKKSDP